MACEVSQSKFSINSYLFSHLLTMFHSYYIQILTDVLVVKIL